MNSEQLPRPVGRGLQMIAAGRGAFGRLMRGRGVGPILGFRSLKWPERDAMLVLLRKHGVDTSSGLARALVELFESPAVVVNDVAFGSASKPSSVAEYLWGSEASPHPVVRSIFQALAFGEEEFCSRDLPQKSHEERLTGHLLSKLYSSLLFCGPAIEAAAEQLYGRPATLDLAYHDLSTGNREKVTGSDFGVILHLDLPDLGERVSAAMIQAKKLGREVSYLKREQLEAQRKFASEPGAYCCFYDTGAAEPLPPAIVHSEKVLEDARPTASKIGYERKNVLGEAVPLSLFLIWLASRDDLGVRLKTLGEASRLMIRGTRGVEVNQIYPGPSRILTISVSTKGIAHHELESLRQLFGVDDTRSRSEETPE